MAEGAENLGEPSSLPPPPPTIPTGVKPELVERSKYGLAQRPDVGQIGKPIQLRANYFKVSLPRNNAAVFYHYTVNIYSEKNSKKNSLVGGGIARKVVDQLFRTYSSELGVKTFAYDGAHGLYTVGQLARSRYELDVAIEESSRKGGRRGDDGSSSSSGTGKRARLSVRPKIFIVELDYAAKIPLETISLALRGVEPDNAALRALHIILRQQAANCECLLVRDSFFHDDSRNYFGVGGGVSSLQGFHSSFRPTQGGLSLNTDVTMTLVLNPGPVIDFLLYNQNIEGRDLSRINWELAGRMLKNLRIRTSHTNLEYKITGLSRERCANLSFTRKVKNGNSDVVQTEETTVSKYFAERHGPRFLRYSGDLPCINVAKGKQPKYLPLELCLLVSLQRYKRALSSHQRENLGRKPGLKPKERMDSIINAVRSCRYDTDPVLSACKISIAKQLTEVSGRILDSPSLRGGNGVAIYPRNSRWNFNGKKFWAPITIEHWAAVNFSANCDIRSILRTIINCANSKGIQMSDAFTVIEEDQRSARLSPAARVDAMIDQSKVKLPRRPQFILCFLPVRKKCDLYGPWKRKCLCDEGIVTQCICPGRDNDECITSLVLKIHLKLGGVNTMIEPEFSKTLPFVSKIPTLILGMDVSHGPPGRSDVPSIAAVVGSRSWPCFSLYRASLRTQSPRVEMIDSLYKESAGKDCGMIRELLCEFYTSSEKRKPKQIIVFRDGVTESQFNQVLDVELNQIIKAYHKLERGGGILPKFTVIVAQKNHRTRLFCTNSFDNVPPGTVVDTEIVHPRNYDFYMCAHAGRLGTSRPVHYHVLLDEIGFSTDELQNLIHYLSYMCQTSTAAISVVAPIHYAHRAAQQVRQFLEFEDRPETSSAQVTSAGSVPIPELPKINMSNEYSMFFC